MRLPAALLLPLAIAACNSSGGNGTNQAAGVAPAAPGEPAAPAAPAVAATMQPGRWENTYRIVSVNMPGASPEMAAQLRAQPIPPPQVQYSCLTPQEAADMAANFRRTVQQGQANANCQVGEQEFGGGRIRMSMVCAGQNGGPTQRMAIVGGFTGNSLQLAVTADVSTPMGDGTAQSIRAESTVTGRRVGECNGTERD